MSKINPKAFSILMESEKQAMAIQHGMNKSSWAAGEMMKRSHYKYLEIKQRAEQFLRMFTEHYNLFDEVIPHGFGCPHDVRAYLNTCIEKRFKPGDAVECLKVDFPSINKAKINEKLVDVMWNWEKSSDPQIAQIVHIVKEFDRWNNFRILPPSIREPSAFKRRVKNTQKKHLRILASISTRTIKKIRDNYECKNNNYIYFPYLSPTPRVMKVKATKEPIEALSKASLYLFKNKEKALEYIELVYQYVLGGKRDCKNGLIFWPKYREIIKSATNYTRIQNITPNRKYLRLAMEKLELL